MPAARFALTAGLMAVVGLLGPPALAAATPAQIWMVSRNAIDLIDGYTGSRTLATQAFDVSSTVETGVPQAGWVTERTVTFTAYGPASARGSFAYAVSHGTIPPGTTDVLYDDERWSLTPAAEQARPGRYLTAFVTLARAHGYQPILAPAIDLARSMACYKPADSQWVNYVQDCSLPTLVGQASPAIYEIQSQMYETGVPLGVECGCYAWIVTQSAAEARTADATLEVLAGLSTNQSGKVATAQDLYDDTLATQASANGYWLNVPESSTACPGCVPGGAPQVAVGYLHMDGYSG